MLQPEDLEAIEDLIKLWRAQSSCPGDHLAPAPTCVSTISSSVDQQFMLQDNLMPTDFRWCKV